MYKVLSDETKNAKENCPMSRQEIRDFVNKGLKDVQENALSDFKDVFAELESRYKVERV